MNARNTPARPRGRPKTPLGAKSRRVEVWLSDEAAAALDDHATLAGIPPADVIRALIAGAPMPKRRRGLHPEVVSGLLKLEGISALMLDRVDNVLRTSTPADPRNGELALLRVEMLRLGDAIATAMRGPA